MKSSVQFTDKLHLAFGTPFIVDHNFAMCADTSQHTSQQRTNDVPPFSMVGGVPAKIIGRVQLNVDQSVSLEFE